MSILNYTDGTKFLDGTDVDREYQDLISQFVSIAASIEEVIDIDELEEYSIQNQSAITGETQ